MKLALGTVQFGQDYGVANCSGVPDDAALAEILELARTHGVEILDTAILYGSAETRLGQMAITDFGIVTKLPPLDADCPDIGTWVARHIDQSLTRLRRDRLDGLLCHNAADLSHPALAAAFRAAKASGKVLRTGVSIYDPEDLALLIDMEALDLVQGPLNVFDQRIISSGWLARLAERGIGFHARSVFLQGSLLMPAETRPAYFARWAEHFAAWEAWVAETGRSPLAAALTALGQIAGVEVVVLGVERAVQLSEILAAMAQEPLPLPGHLSSADTNLICPANWSLP
ncbi:aldo/keto reductase [Anianabacter salinae]|uniref:aldo/keto reductase n=1 Tax=Anianabacter salinae TaxID=2851023 RepID=UPI00225E020A|nr:aldo/keto reductase [Anianabacter salinae]MBV0914160.1 aldo/keto reductase [Anianabacter salinae]